MIQKMIWHVLKNWILQLMSWMVSLVLSTLIIGVFKLTKRLRIFSGKKAKLSFVLWHSFILLSVSDWFYPFSIEFSILVVAIWYIMWSHIGQIDQHHSTMDILPDSQSLIGEEKMHKDHKDAMILFADCSSSTRGMFLGLIILVLTVIGCIIVVVVMDDCNDQEVIKMTLIFEIVLFIIMTMASIAFYLKIGKLWNLSFIAKLLNFIGISKILRYSLLFLIKKS